MNYEVIVMYIRKKDPKFRRFLKHKAEFDNNSIEIDTIDFAPIPSLVEVFNHSKMLAVLDEHDKRSNLYRNNKRFLDYLGDTNGFLPLVELPDSIFDDLEELRARLVVMGDTMLVRTDNRSFKLYRTHCYLQAKIAFSKLFYNTFL